jgi:hypothetical protein
VILASQAVTVGDILLLAASAPSGPEEELRKIYDWVFERSMAGVRLMFGAAGGIMVALIGVYFKPDTPIAAWQAVLILGSALALVLAGAYRTWKLNVLQREYLEALGLLRLLGPLPPTYLLNR